MTLPQTTARSNHTEITPGPWRVVPFNIGCNIIFDICYEGVRPIGTIAKKANAHLVSAAPDLLEALYDLIFQCNRLKGEDASALDFDQARAAIKRAEGREGE